MNQQINQQIDNEQTPINGLSMWEASKGLSRKPVKLECKDLTPELLNSLKKHIPTYKPDRWFSPSPDVVMQEKKRGNQPTELDNSMLVEWFNHSEYYSANEELLIQGIADDIFHGVARLDLGGNTRPFNKVTLYRLISNMNHLSSKAIMDALGVKERQARRYMAACAICHRMLVKEIATGRLKPMTQIDIDDAILDKWEKKSLSDEYDN